MKQDSNLNIVNRRQTVINAVSNYGQYAVGIMVGLFLQAYLIRRLGADEYALWPLVQTCMGFAALIPIGIGTGAARFLSHALGRNNFEELEEITSSLFFALLAAALVYLLCIAVFSLYFEKIFDMPRGTAGIGPWVMLLTGLSGAVAIPFGVFNGGLRAGQKFVILNTIRVALLLMRLLLVVLLFSLCSPSLIWLGGVYLFLELLSGIAAFTAVKHAAPWNRVRWRSFRWSVMWKVNRFSLLVLVTHIAGLLYWKTDNIIINKLLDPDLLTGYSVVANFVLFSHQLAALGISVLIPASTLIYAQGDYSRLGRLLYRANRTVVPLAVSFQVFLIVFGKDVLAVYLGNAYIEYAVLFPLLAGGAVISVTQSAASIVPQAFGKLLPVSIISLITAIANVVLTIFFVVVLKWGLLGVAAGTATVLVVNKLLFWPWYTARLLKIPLSRYFRESCLVPWGNCLPVVCVMLCFYGLGIGESLGGLIGVIAVCALIHSTYMLCWGLDVRDRNSIKNKWARFFG